MPCKAAANIIDVDPIEESLSTKASDVKGYEPTTLQRRDFQGIDEPACHLIGPIKS